MGAIGSFDVTSRGKTNWFNSCAYFASAGVVRRAVEYRVSEQAYSQGEPAKNVLYIQKGGVKLSLVNPAGKEAIVAILGPGDFFGEGCLAGQIARSESATAITPSIVVAIEKQDMIRMLRSERAFSDRFVSYMLSRHSLYVENLIDHLFNSSEKRLARTLLLLTRCGPRDQTRNMLPRISQKMLAEMIGTTRPRVNYFMKKFRELGYINYNSGGLQINRSLLNVVLHD
jgi:CRP/FNR family cyclic AMP-dependent transcriptional regulator